MLLAIFLYEKFWVLHPRTSRPPLSSSTSLRTGPLPTPRSCPLVVTCCFLMRPSLAQRSGLGFNNFREWEALTAGAIPLVDDVPSLRPLWRGMPVVRVQDWAQITPEFLAAKEAEFLANRATLNVNKAYLPYWLHRLSRGLLGRGQPRSFSARCNPGFCESTFKAPTTREGGSPLELTEVQEGENEGEGEGEGETEGAAEGQGVS